MKSFTKNRAAKRAWADLVSSAMPETGKRLRPRDPDEAQLLAARGTRPELIGPRRIVA